MGAVAAPVLGAPISTILIVFEMSGDYAVTLAVMVGVIASTGLAHGLAGHSFFTWQLARRGIELKPSQAVGRLADLRVGGQHHVRAGRGQRPGRGVQVARAVVEHRHPRPNGHRAPLVDGICPAIRGSSATASRSAA